MKQNYPLKDSDSFLLKSGYDILDEYRIAVENAAFSTDKTVLDVATGSGRMAYTLCSAGYIVVTGDVDQDVLCKTIASVGHFFPGKLSFTVFDALNLPYPDMSFDNVVSANSLHELDDPMTALSEMTRVVSSGGNLLLIDFNENGFDVISKAHNEMHGKDHRRGFADYMLVMEHLESQFKRVNRLTLGLNYVWISEGKKS